MLNRASKWTSIYQDNTSIMVQVLATVSSHYNVCDKILQSAKTSVEYYLHLIKILLRITCGMPFIFIACIKPIMVHLPSQINS